MHLDLFDVDPNENEENNILYSNYTVLLLL